VKIVQSRQELLNKNKGIFDMTEEHSKLLRFENINENVAGLHV
jgi:hypothetical protein